MVELPPVNRAEIVFGAYAGKAVVDDAAFEAADAEVRALWGNVIAPREDDLG